MLFRSGGVAPGKKSLHSPGGGAHRATQRVGGHQDVLKQVKGCELVDWAELNAELRRKDGIFIVQADHQASFSGNRRLQG